jgi:alpha-ribazole phosphatase
MERLYKRLQGEKLAGIYSSDLVRTVRGAEIIGRAHNVSRQAFPEFREMHFGRWQSLTYSQVMERHPEDIPRWIAGLETFRVPEGESMADLRGRVMPALRELIERHRGQEFALVCHGAVNRMVLAEALGLPYGNLLRIEQDYGCLNVIDYSPSYTSVRLVNG